MWLIDLLIDCMNVFCNISFIKFWLRWKFLNCNSKICIFLTKAWWKNFKSTVTVYSKYFHGGENINNPQRSIYEGKPSPNTSPGLNYSCEEPFFTLGYWKAYDEVILMTSWACQTSLSFGRDEICRQPQFEGSPGETNMYCWQKYIWQNWALIHLVRTASFGLQAVCSALVHWTMHLLPCNSFQMISGYSLRYGLFT